MENRIDQLEDQLNDFDAGVRAEALDELMMLADQGEIDLPEPEPVANMHCHTFFSYNGYGFSPTALAWLAKRRGYKLMGIVDFDVLDAVDEFLTAADRVRLRSSAGMETRAYVPEFADREINSPGEPGIYYHMGIGFISSEVPKPATKAQAILDDMRERAEQRNRDMVERVNAYLDPVTINYEEDVLPLTPAGNATERHMCVAYVEAADEIVQDPVHFWAAKLEVPQEQVAAVIDRGPQIQNLVRSKLMKRGGVGYVQPGPDTFPTVEEVNTVITACGALPCITWLDGTSEGEQAAPELFDLMIRKGAVALNIIPDRNWNIPDPKEKETKLQNLYDVVDLARELDLPINVGTEMNAYGKPLIDDFSAPELAPVRRTFLDGAHFIYGHTLLARALGLGYQSRWAKGHFPDRHDRNVFYTELGRRVPPGPAARMTLRELGLDPDPAVVITRFPPSPERL
ncbi:MAG: hypothetical protein ACP5JG_00800 [Anaerolineae bacterium]